MSARRTTGGLVVVLTLVCGCATSEAQKSYQLRKDMLRAAADRAQWESAFPMASQLLAEKPEDAEVLAIRGVIYREQGLYQEAEADLREALAADDGLAFAHAGLAVLYDLTGRQELALPHHERAAELAPESVAYANNLGFCYFVRGKTEKAIEAYRKAMRIDPTFPRLHNNLGFAYARKGDYASALRHFTHGGTPAEARNNLGVAYEQAENLAQARDMYQEALRLDPELEQAKNNLAHVEALLGRGDAAAAGLPATEATQDTQGGRP